MFRNRLYSVFGVLVAIAMLATACAPAATPTATAAPATAAPATATAVPPRHGGWLDEIDYSIVDAASVVTQIGAGAVDMFSYGLASDKLAEIKSANPARRQAPGGCAARGCGGVRGGGDQLRGVLSRR